MMLFHFLIGLADVWVAGYIDRKSRLRSVSYPNLFFFLLVVAMAVANGAVAAISQSLGAGLIHRVKRYIGLCLILATILGGAFLFIGMPLKNLMLSALQIPMEHATGYRVFS